MAHKICLVLCIVMAGMLGHCMGARILCLSHQYGSHLLMVHSVGEGLIQRGHEVYSVLSDKMKVPKGLREKGFKVLNFHSPDDHPILSSPEMTKSMLDQLTSTAASNSHLQGASESTVNECLDMDADKSLEQELRSLKFDLAIINIFPVSGCMMFMALKLDIPFIIIQADIDMDMMHTPALPSFTPHSILALSDDMTFYERLQNTMMTTVSSIPAIAPFNSIRDVHLLQKYKKGPEIETWKDLARKAELFMIARGHLLEYALPLTPNVINIECLTCKPGKVLASEIEALIEKYERVVVVSFGSQVDHLPSDITEKFLEAFSEMKDAIFIWRFKGKLPSNAVPSNVKIMKWLPQNDLLAHPKTKLFITHSGNNGQYESIYHGVPMLAFPLFADQPHNAKRVVVHGYGLSADIHAFTTVELVDKMTELLDNVTYHEKTQKASIILKAAPMNGVETAAFWVEHILEFGGHHLKSHALNMPWYSYYMFDILILVETIIVLTICSKIYMFRMLARYLRGRKKKIKKE